MMKQPCVPLDTSDTDHARYARGTFETFLGVIADCAGLSCLVVRKNVVKGTIPPTWCALLTERLKRAQRSDRKHAGWRRL